MYFSGLKSGQYVRTIHEVHGEVSNPSKAGTGHFCQRRQVTRKDTEAFAAVSTRDRRLNSCSHYTADHYLRDCGSFLTRHTNFQEK